MNRFLHWPGHAWLSLPARFYLGYVFILACIHKIAYPGVFALDIATYDILPLAAINLTAIVLPWIEFFAGVMLIAGWRVRAASLLVAAMMFVFLAAVCIAVARGLDMSCGCFASQGAEEDPISRVTIFRDTVWLGLALFVAAVDRGVAGLDGRLERRLS